MESVMDARIECDNDFDSSYVSIIRKQIKTYDTRFNETEKHYNKYVEIKRQTTDISDHITNKYAPNGNINAKTTEHEDKNPYAETENNLTCVSTKMVKQNTTALINQRQFNSLIDSHTEQLDNKSEEVNIKDIHQIKDIRNFYNMIVKDGKLMYRCKWENCKFGLSLSRNSMLRHIYIKHIELKCSQPNCSKTFNDMRSFTIHLKTCFRIDNKELAHDVEIKRKITHFTNRLKKKYAPKRESNAITDRKDNKSDIKTLCKRRNNITSFRPNMVKPISAEAMTNHHTYSSLISTQTEPIDKSDGVLLKEINQIKDIQKFCERIDKNGKRMYRCKWENCKFGVSLSRNHIFTHIYIKHIELKCTEQNCDKTFKDARSFFLHRKSHYRRHNKDFTHTVVSNNEKKRKSQQQQPFHEMISKYSSSQWRMDNKDHIKGTDEQLPNSVYAGVISAKNVAQYRERCVVNGKYLHRCKWFGCNYETQSALTIVTHIQVKHIGTKELRCSVTGCGKTFKYPTSLALHLKYHLCGFRIDPEKYKYGKGLCSYYNINKYYKRVETNDMSETRNNSSFHCKWIDCYHICKTLDHMQRHIHSQHICPNRVSEKSITEILSSELFSKYKK